MIFIITIYHHAPRDVFIYRRYAAIIYDLRVACCCYWDGLIEDDLWWRWFHAAATIDGFHDAVMSCGHDARWCHVCAIAIAIIAIIIAASRQPPAATPFIWDRMPMIERERRRLHDINFSIFTIISLISFSGCRHVDFFFTIDRGVSCHFLFHHHVGFSSIWFFIACRLTGCRHHGMFRLFLRDY